MSIRVTHLSQGQDLSPALEIRRQVFQQEQGIPEADDFDGLDDRAEQFVAYDGEIAIGAGRYRVVDGSLGKVERVAVIPEYRGQKVGRAIMETIAQTAEDQGVTRLTLDAQLSASRFYESLGYRIEGEVFEEVGIPHAVMTLDLSNVTRQDN